MRNAVPKNKSGNIGTWLFAKPFAHRGLHNHEQNIPENSIAAFKAAIELGLGIELDVQIAYDGVAVVFHDENLDRMTKETGPVAALSSNRLARIKLLDSDETIPTLSEVLNLVQGRVPVLIEVKSQKHTNHRLVSAVRHALEGYGRNVGVMSFDPMIPRWFTHQGARCAKGLVLTRHGKAKGSWIARTRLGRWFLMKHAKAQFIACDIRDVKNASVINARQHGMPVVSWTVRTEGDLNIAKKYVDNVIFENLDTKQVESAMDKSMRSK